jgi:hypothetical protein
MVIRKLIFWIAALLICRPSFATVAFDAQAGHGTSGTSPLSVSITTSTATDVLVAYIVVSGGNTVSSVSGGTSVTWSSIGSTTLPTSSNIAYVYQGLTTSLQSSSSVSISFSGGNAVCIIDAYKGAATTSPCEAINWTNETSQTGTMNGSVTTVTANALAVGAGIFSVGGTITSLTQGSGFTEGQNIYYTNGVSLTLGGLSEYDNSTTSSPGSVTVPVVQAGGANFTGAIVGISIKPAASATNHNLLPMIGVG